MQSRVLTMSNDRSSDDAVDADDADDAVDADDADDADDAVDADDADDADDAVDNRNKEQRNIDDPNCMVEQETNENATKQRDHETSSPLSSQSESSNFSYNLVPSTNSQAQAHTHTQTQLQSKKIQRKSKPPSILATLYHLHIQKSLYKGSTPIALTLALSNFIFFYTLQVAKGIFRQKSTSLLTSTLAGVINVLLTNPLWVANLRIIKDTDTDDEYGNAKGLFQCLREIYKKEGVGQLWAGTGASLLLVSNPVIQYYFYENVKLDLLLKKRHMTSRGGGVVSSLALAPMEAFVVGALAKGLATVVTYPLQLAQVLMRLQKNEKEAVDDDDDDPDASKRKGNSVSFSRGGGGKSMNRKSHIRENTKVYDNLFHCVQTLYRQGGIKALYSGMDAKLLQAVLTSAITFLTYEQILQFVGKSYWLLKRLESGSTVL